MLQLAKSYQATTTQQPPNSGGRLLLPVANTGEFLPLSNFTAKFRRSIQKCHPQRANSTTAPKNTTHKNSPPNPKNATQQQKYHPQKAKFHIHSHKIRLKYCNLINENI